jgi:hypothetical protein
MPGDSLSAELSQLSGNVNRIHMSATNPQAMSNLAIQPQKSQRPTREEGIAIASERKAARRRRTSRLRKTVAVIAACAFIGPFGIIATRMAAGKDPALATTHAVATKVSGPVNQGTASATASAKRDAAAAAAGSSSSGSSSSGSATTASPAAVTTQQS